MGQCVSPAIVAAGTSGSGADAAASVARAPAGASTGAGIGSRGKRQARVMASDTGSPPPGGTSPGTAQPIVLPPCLSVVAPKRHTADSLDVGADASPAPSSPPATSSIFITTARMTAKGSGCRPPGYGGDTTPVAASAVQVALPLATASTLTGASAYGITTPVVASRSWMSGIVGATMVSGCDLEGGSVRNSSRGSGAASATASASASGGVGALPSTLPAASSSGPSGDGLSGASVLTGASSAAALSLATAGGHRTGRGRGRSVGSAWDGDGTHGAMAAGVPMLPMSLSLPPAGCLRASPPAVGPPAMASLAVVTVPAATSATFTPEVRLRPHAWTTGGGSVSGTNGLPPGAAVAPPFMMAQTPSLSPPAPPASLVGAGGRLAQSAVHSASTDGPTFFNLGTMDERERAALAAGVLPRLPRLPRWSASDMASEGGRAGEDYTTAVSGPTDCSHGGERRTRRGGGGSTTWYVRYAAADGDILVAASSEDATRHRRTLPRVGAHALRPTSRGAPPTDATGTPRDSATSHTHNNDDGGTTSSVVFNALTRR